MIKEVKPEQQENGQHRASLLNRAVFGVYASDASVPSQQKEQVIAGSIAGITLLTKYLQSS